MKVLLITEDFPPMPGGVARFLQNLCVYSQAEISVLAPEVDDGESQVFDNCQLYSISRFRMRSHLTFLTLLFSACFKAATFRPDVIFWGHAPWVAVVGRWLKALFHIPLAILVHSTEVNISLNGGFLSRRLIISALRGADLVFANSRHTSRNIERLGVPVERLHLLNPGVDVQQFKPDVDVSDLEQLYGHDRKRVLLTVSRLVAKKNHSAVLRALPRVLKQVPDTLYLIVGDGPEQSNIQQLCENLGLTDHVIFIPNTTGQDLVKLYNICDAFVMVSKTVQIDNLPGAPEDVESFGIVFIEAGACMKPVIGGRSGGVPDAVLDGETGLLVDPHNTDAIANAIILLLTNHELARRLSENGRRRVEQEFSWEKVGDRLERYLKQVQKKR